MNQFTDLHASAAIMDLLNVDTDMIIPKQFLKTIKRTGLGKFLFFDLRYDNEGKENPDFVLNQPPYRDAQILICGANFGCGSSREHAPWALLDFGVKAMIAPSFADIFYNNCFKNGILPIILDQAEIDKIIALLRANKRAQIAIDLDTQEITLPDGGKITFPIDAFRKKCLLEGLDDITLTLQQKSAIGQFETRQKTSHPWLYM